ncbi:GSCFA domain-containing protein [Amaricoccus macauensis]|uniref:GSCFA domain-containing protein n=1 Tax=Amaricoccus macauensis TaxID=57001 RepID=UPI003C7A7736
MTDLEDLVIRTGKHAQRFNGTWYRGNQINFIPSKKLLRDSEAIEKYILKGWLPDRPLIDKDSVVTAFGSCFAQNISEWLEANGYNVLGKKLSLNSHIIRFGEGIVNSFAIREQLEWALEGLSLTEGLWFGANKEIAFPDEDVRKNTETLLKSTSTLIITLGLSEIWYDKQSGRAFWRAVPSSIFDEERHGFRLSTVEENRDNLVRICELVGTHMPDCNLVFTLSPIPLMATFRDVSCLSANSVSKAILRVAIDSAISQSRENVYYFPSYEIVKEYFTDPYRDDNRHIKPEIVETIMNVFGKHYCAA